MGKIKLALIGAGERGQYCYAPYAKLHGYEVEFVAVADPDESRRTLFAQTYAVPANGQFETAEAFFAAAPQADAVMICTQDQQHFDIACTALRMGYHLLLEKPISPSAAECLALQTLAEEKGRIVMVCHVMRYTKFYRKIKEILDSGVIGDVVHITHTENVGYWHYAHSYVRGNWHKTADASPMILAKCCHDMDILSWLLNSRCKTISSFGDLRYFKAENAPAGSPDRCTDGCAHSATCPYYAPALYLSDDITWSTAYNALGTDRSYAARKKALEEGPYGKCVFHNDNDVVDHQVASLLFENGTTVAFTMCAFTNACDRTLKFMGTKGEIRASMDQNEITVTEFGAGIMSGTTNTYHVIPGGTGHSGGDEGIMEEFISVLQGLRPNTNTIAQSVHSHVMALAAEESRLSGNTIKIADFEASVRQK
ncbi:MAG: Gfo/Idh/MocA family oxidoreductase [Ruthenibacterium sp.]